MCLSVCVCVRFGMGNKKAYDANEDNRYEIVIIKWARTIFSRKAPNKTENV